MDKNAKCVDEEQRGSPAQRRRIPPARRVKQQAPQHGGKGSCSAEGTSKQCMVEMVELAKRHIHGSC